MASPGIFGRLGITWLAVIGPALGGVLNHTLCQSTSVTVPLQNDTGTPEAYGFLISDPGPEGVDASCSTRLHFNSTVQLKVTLTKVLVWNKTQGAESGGFGWKVGRKDGKKTLLWTEIKDQSWKNYSSDSCPYLYVKDESQEAVQLRVNISQEFLTRLVDISLLGVPDSAWCDVTVQYTAVVASKPVKELCQTAGEFYCKSSASCVNPSQRCNGLPDCSNGEDEEDCSYETTTDAFALASAPGVVSAVSVAVVAFIVATAVIVAVLCRRQSLSKRLRDAKYKEEAVYSTCVITSQVDHGISEKPVKSAAGRLLSTSDTLAGVENETLYDMVDPSYHLAQPQETLRPDRSPSDSCDLNAYATVHIAGQRSKLN